MDPSKYLSSFLHGTAFPGRAEALGMAGVEKTSLEAWPQWTGEPTAPL